MTARATRPVSIALEVSLAAITMAAVLGMSRLFDDRSWIVPLTLNAVAAHLVAVALRRRHVPLPLAGVITAAAAGLAITWTGYWSTTVLGLPTGRTWARSSADLSHAWTLYRSVVAPAPVAAGFVLASIVAVWVVAYLADWAAFRLAVPLEATVPAGTLFVFTSLVGAAGGRTWAVILFASALLAFLLLHHLADQDRSSHWVADRQQLGRRSLLVAGAGVGGLAVLAGSLLGPSFPGATAPGLLDPRALRSDGARVTVSPLVDIRSRLVNQANVEAFTVRSPVRSYWRLTSLDRFDGQIWSSSGTYSRASGVLPEAVSSDVVTQTFDQTITISALSAIWLPTAFEPRAIEAIGAKVRYDKESATLIVDNDTPSSNGLSYRVTSVSPRISVDDLTHLRGSVPKAIRDRYLELPTDFSVRVHDLARALTTRADGPAAQARALQDYLRTFTYSLDVQPGHSQSALEDFLLSTKTGYCEQFAGAFAAMARSLGLPTRVAVGFTPGDPDRLDPQVFHVRGEYAHAWPEVYFAGAGWVAYEPTPGRGIPNAEAYTGVPDQQAAASNPGGGDLAPPTSVGATIPSGPSTTVGRGSAGHGSGDTAGQRSATAPAPTLERLVVHPLARLAPVVGGLALSYVVLFPLSLVVWRARRRRRATTAHAQIDLAWHESVEVAGLIGFAERASDTYQERARALADTVPTAEPAVVTLAGLRERAAYTPSGATEADADAARALAQEIMASARQLATRADRSRAWLDPRAVLGGWRRGHTARQRRITQTARGDLEQERELVGSADRG